MLTLFNLVEGFFWIGLAVWILLSTFISSKHHKALLAVILILFGISDFVEMATGAWWRPWWLLVWKALCVLIGLILIILIFKSEKRQR
jgi:uncharacterized membrane protein HdeD (DUF308 family)